jgi:hypothetical protein
MSALKAAQFAPRKNGMLLTQSLSGCQPFAESGK